MAAEDKLRTQPGSRRQGPMAESQGAHRRGLERARHGGTAPFTSLFWVKSVLTSSVLPAMTGTPMVPGANTYLLTLFLPGERFH